MICNIIDEQDSDEAIFPQTLWNAVSNGLSKKNKLNSLNILRIKYAPLSLPSENKRRVGQGVKTPPFHGGVTGSIPVRATKYNLSF